MFAEQMDSLHSPLASVVVISYNSAATILETLDSVAGQTYGNLELIVSDDCSKDDTVPLVQEWMLRHGGIFRRAQLVQAACRGGLVSNINRGVAASGGKYLKVMAADDKLVPDAMVYAVDYMERNGYDFCISAVDVFSSDGAVPQGMVDAYRRYFNNVKESLPEKKRRMAWEYALPTVGAFYTRKIFDCVGGVDPLFPMWDEFPFVWKVLHAGCDIKPIDKVLVLYRYSGHSLSQISSAALYDKAYFRDYRRVFYKFQLTALLGSGRWFKAFRRLVSLEVYRLRYNSGWGARFLVRCFDSFKRFM